MENNDLKKISNNEVFTLKARIEKLRMEYDLIQSDIQKLLRKTNYDCNNPLYKEIQQKFQRIKKEYYELQDLLKR